MNPDDPILKPADLLFPRSPWERELFVPQSSHSSPFAKRCLKYAEALLRARTLARLLYDAAPYECEDDEAIAAETVYAAVDQCALALHNLLLGLRSPLNEGITWDGILASIPPNLPLYAEVHALLARFKDASAVGTRTLDVSFN